MRAWWWSVVVAVAQRVPEECAPTTEFAPDRRGTALGAGRRWGAWNPEAAGVVTDEAGVLGPDCRLELLASGFRWTEGPLWSKTRQKLYFSDTIDDRLYTWSAEEGVRIAAEEAGGGGEGRFFEPGANGLGWVDGEGKIAACQHGARRVAVIDAETMAVETVLATTAPNGRRLNSPNDVVARGGDVYFTDPMYGLLLRDERDSKVAKGTPDGLPADQPYVDDLAATIGAGAKAVYRVGLDGGGLVEISRALLRPNGLGFDARGRLWVANSGLGNSSWSAFDPDRPGADPLLTIPYAPAFDDMGPGAVDGFDVDPDTGLVWSSAPGGIVVIDLAHTGQILAAFKLGTHVSNVALADDGHVFITGAGHLWRLSGRRLPGPRAPGNHP